VIKPESKLTRRQLIDQLNTKGFECRPIVSGNFAKNEVLKHFDHSIHGSLEHADYIDQNGLFIGNHHYPIEAAIEALREI
jgi:CDP-6-deoxy-D-xylo-4-hexulose-3-dehydrase